MMPAIIQGQSQSPLEDIHEEHLFHGFCLVCNNVLAFPRTGSYKTLCGTTEYYEEDDDEDVTCELCLKVLAGGYCPFCGGKFS